MTAVILHFCPAHARALELRARKERTALAGRWQAGADGRLRMIWRATAERRELRACAACA